MLLIKDSEAKYIYDVLNSTNEKSNKMILDIDFKSDIDMKMNKIEIFGTAEIIHNPVIHFLKDLIEHKHLIRKYKLDIKYVLGQCSKCRDKNFMVGENGCLSGGRYCVINSEYR